MTEEEALEQLANQDLSALTAKELSSYREKAKSKGWTRVEGALRQASHGPTRTFLSDATDALTFNFADEAMAGIKAPFSEQSYGDILSQYNTGRKARATRNPIASTAGDITGNMASVVGALGIPGGQAAILARLASGGAIRAGAKGAAAGALSEGTRSVGRGQGEGLTDRFIGGAALGGAMGGALGVGSRFGELAIKKIKSSARLGKRPPLEKRALKDISKTLNADRLDPVNNPIKKGLENLNREAVLADSSREMQELGGALVRHSDATRNPLGSIVKARSEGAPERISGMLDRLVHPYKDAMDFIPESREAIKAGQAKYDEVLGASGPVDITSLLGQNTQAARYSGSPRVASEVNKVNKFFRRKPFLSKLLDEGGEEIGQEVLVPPKSLLRSAEDFDELAKRSGGGAGIEFSNISQRAKSLLKDEVEGFGEAASDYERIMRDRSNFDAGTNLFRGRPDYDIISEIKTGQKYDPLDDNTVAKGMRVGMQELIDRSPRAHERLYSEAKKPITSKFLRDLGPANVDKALAKELGIEDTYETTSDILSKASIARDREAASSLFADKEPGFLEKLMSMGLSGLGQNMITLPSRGQRNLIKGSTPVSTHTPAANISPREASRLIAPARSDVDNKMMEILASQGGKAAGYADDLHKFTVNAKNAEEIARLLRMYGFLGGGAGLSGLGAANAY